MTPAFDEQEFLLNLSHRVDRDTLEFIARALDDVRRLDWYAVGPGRFCNLTECGDGWQVVKWVRNQSRVLGAGKTWREAIDNAREDEA
jgi:hypothetical protein